MDRLKTIINTSTDFGTISYRNSFWSFLLKIFMFLIPAMIISHILDENMETLYKYVSPNIIGQIVILFIQIVIMIAILYFFVVYFEKYQREFQTTTAGGFFIALFFGFQPHFLKNLKDIMRHLI